MSWPAIKTAHALVAEGIVPCSEDKLRALAKEYGIGRILGRAYVFTPADVAALVEKLPCPSSSSKAVTAPRTGTSAVPSGASALTRALALSTRKARKKSSSGARRKSSTSPSTVIALSEHSRTQR
jgi:hypothetical protein